MTIVNSLKPKLTLILLTILTVQLALPVAIYADSNSSGNDVKREIQTGLDLQGRSKTEVIKLVGPPKTKDRTPSKGRYTEKWTYSCQDKRGAKKNCVYLYFSGDRVKKVEVN